MRIDLKGPLVTQRADGVARATAACRAAHRAHEDAGGYAMEFASYIASQNGHPEQAAANASINRHLKIQEHRRAALAAIGQAQHGAAISMALDGLKSALGTQ